MKQCLIYDNSLRFARAIYGFLALAAFLTHNMWLVLITAIIMAIGLITADKYNFFLQLHQQVLRRLLKDTSEPLSRDVWELRFACGLGTIFLLVGFCLVYFGKFVNLGWILVLILSLVMLLSGLAGICMATLFYAGFKKFLGKK